jgi:hypothetical protein
LNLTAYSNHLFTDFINTHIAMLLRIDRSAGAARANDPRRREVIRRDKLRAMKREHIRERKENLANLFKEDANVDWWSLKKDWWEPLRMSK